MGPWPLAAGSSPPQIAFCNLRRAFPAEKAGFSGENNNLRRAFPAENADEPASDCFFLWQMADGTAMASGRRICRQTPKPETSKP